MSVELPSSALVELRSWIAKEAESLVRRLGPPESANAVRELETARQAFDAAARSITSVLTTTPATTDHEIGTFVERLVTSSGFDTVRTRLSELDQENARLRTELNDAQAKLKTVRGELRTERDRGDAARVDLARTTAEFDQAVDELRREHATAVTQQSEASISLPLDELVAVFGALEKATTPSDALATLADALAREFSRVALFDVHASRLECTHQTGFDIHVSQLTVPLSHDSLLARAVKSGRFESVFTGPDHKSGTGLPFEGTPACALALPLVVQGSMVAMAYADDSEKPEFTTSPHARAKFAELVHAHTLLVLLRIWVDQRTRAELREFATMLVNELEYGYTASANAGTNALERQQQLRNALECSRRIYAQRIAGQEETATALLDEQLDAVVEAKSDTGFGQDLASVLGRANTAPRPRVVSMRR